MAPDLTAPASSGVRLLLCLKVAIEMVFAFAVTTFTWISLAYLLHRRRGGPVSPAVPPPSEVPDVGVLYLCCGDFDQKALGSLLQLRHPGTLHVVVHDDTPGGDRRLDEWLEECSPRDGVSIHVLRRPDKCGGKPGAINYVLDRVGHLFDCFLLCDNDSTALDHDSIGRLLPYLDDPRVAAVQARNTAVEASDYCSVNRVLCRAIDVFHLFLSVGQRFGWTPCVGHNALIRTEAVRDVGGLTPGCFADDIDLTARWNLAGYKVRYAPEVRFGERHPPSYTAFRRRAWKWACGSVQVLRRHAWPMLRTDNLTAAEKWGFFHFIGFYSLQALMLAYVVLTFLVLPFLVTDRMVDPVTTVVAGTVMPALIFLPVLAYALRERWLRSLPAFLLTCWIGYGGADFPTARGAVTGCGRRARRWIPTNCKQRTGVDGAQLGEAVFGAALLLIPLWKLPVLLLSPLTYLVALKFLFLPTLSELYQDGKPRGAAWEAIWLRRFVTAGVLLLSAGFLLSFQARPQKANTASAVEVRGNRLFVGGDPFVVRGVHYSPWRPGTGPGHDSYPERSSIVEDMELLEASGANSILVFDAPRYVLDEAWSRGLRVLYAFWFDWKKFGEEDFVIREDECLAKAEALRDHPALLGWVIGNEIPAQLVSDHGKQVVEEWLRRMFSSLEAIDPEHPITHANWPNTRDLDLSFLDLAAFNVYALWPPEVVARGYGNYVAEVLAPIAGDRPLLITEYGANSLEAGATGQARLIRECWQGLRTAGAIGGFAFEFADEWWKNYDNPKLPGAYWDRRLDPKDHLTHDADPEEYYGLVTGERRPKPAYAAVAEIYASPVEPPSKPVDWTSVVVVAFLTVSAGGFLIVFFAGRRRSRDSHYFKETGE